MSSCSILPYNENEEGFCWSSPGEPEDKMRDDTEVDVTETKRESLMNVAPLSARQLEVARLAAEGLTTEEIGKRIGVRMSTAKNHLTVAMKLLGVTRRHMILDALKKYGIHVDKSDIELKAPKRPLRTREIAFIRHLKNGGTLPQFAEEAGMSLEESKAFAKSLLRATGGTRLSHLVYWAEKNME